MSADGKRVAWTYQTGEKGEVVAIYDIAAGKRVEVVFGPGEAVEVPGWSADSSKAWVVKMTKDAVEVFTVNAGDAGLSRECELLGIPQGMSVSPSGGALCIILKRPDGKLAVTLVGGPHHEVKSIGLEEEVIRWVGYGWWSPDSTMIALPLSTKDQYRWRLMVLRARDWEKRFLPFGVGPTFAWSPDSSRLLSWRGAEKGAEIVSIAAATSEVTRHWSLPEIKFPSLIRVEATSGLLAVPSYGDRAGRVWVCSPDGGVHELPSLGSRTGNVAWTSVKDWLLVAHESPTGRLREPDNRWLGKEERLSLVNWRSDQIVELRAEVSFWRVSADGGTLVIRGRLLGKEEEGVFVCDLCAFLRDIESESAPGDRP